MASDDHFETVNVAYNWFVRGFYSDEGNLIWRHHTDGEITRIPLYTFVLHGIMRLYYWCGVESLDTMMYGIRAAHALLSLVMVYSAYRLVELVTGERKWAVVAGLVMACHGLMPYLSVRALIEMVGGELLLLAFYWLYRYLERGEQRWLFWAGIMVGLAWMIRMQVVAAVLPVPFVLWWQARSVAAPIRFLAGGIVVLLSAGVTDYVIVGEWFGTVIGTLTAGHEEHYNTIFLIYPVVLLAFFLPPISILAAAACFSRAVWRRHKILILGVISFILVHMIVPNRQERFMLPIVGILGVLFVLAIRQQFKNKLWLSRWPRVLNMSLAVAGVLNLGLLVLFTANYGHRGLVEPLARVQQMSPRPRVVLISPERHQIYPLYYAGMPLVDNYWVRNWQELRDFLPGEPGQDLYLVYPPKKVDELRYRDSLELVAGGVEELFRVGPSVVDWTLHRLNPRHNPTHECVVYRRASPGGTGGAE